MSSNTVKATDLKTSQKEIEMINSDSNIDWRAISLFCVFVFITIFTYPYNNNSGKVTPQDVWYYGWITAVSTGLGVVPFYIFSKPGVFWRGVCNAVAAGMMIAASYSLVKEGLEPIEGFYGYHSGYRLFAGFLLGIVFIHMTKKYLDGQDELEYNSISGHDVKKILLIIFVMTLHSFSEGVGIGVSFGGEHGTTLGRFISFSFAMHNIPEGLAVALVLTSRNITKFRAGLWAIVTSLPQPIMAVPSFIFIETFIPLLPTGLGFASGAMIYVAMFELIEEAIEDTNLTVTAISITISFTFMYYIQEVLKLVS